MHDMRANVAAVVLNMEVQLTVTLSVVFHYDAMSQSRCSFSNTDISHQVTTSVTKRSFWHSAYLHTNIRRLSQ